MNSKIKLQSKIILAIICSSVSLFAKVLADPPTGFSHHQKSGTATTRKNGRPDYEELLHSLLRLYGKKLGTNNTVLNRSIVEKISLILYGLDHLKRRSSYFLSRHLLCT